jgi:hypothetical protein
VTLQEGLSVANAAARDARLRSLAQICDPVGLQAPLTDGQIDGLRPWLATLRSTVEQSNWRAARVGLDRWLATANEYQTTAETARTANCAALDKRDELAGLLRARTAQATDLARRGVYLSPATEEVARRAKAQLSELPCHLEEAEESVAQFDAAVSALAHSARPH